MINIIRVIYRNLFPPSLDEIFSEEGKERTALHVAARFTRGNTGVQNGHATTDRKFKEEMRRMARRVSHTHSPSL
jgi:hypothetical protein